VCLSESRASPHKLFAMKIDYSGWLGGGINLKPKGGTGVVPAIIPNEDSFRFSRDYLYMEAEMRSVGIFENVYITAYGDFDFSSEESSNSSEIDSYLLLTDNFGSAMMDNMNMDLEDLLDNPKSLQKKWLSRDNEIFGTFMKDKINASDGDDIIYGGAGKDKIKGGKGDDYLDGGGNGDILRGNGGDDVFVVSGYGSVIIKDFMAKDDLIELKGISLSDVSIETTNKHAFIVNEDGYWIAKLNGAPDIGSEVFI